MPWALLAAALVAASAGADTSLPEADCGGLYWDLTAVFDAGDRVYARVLVTNEGPGEHSAVALGHWIEPDGHATEFQNGRRWGRWDLEARGRRLRIGSTQLDLSEAVLHFEVDNDKRGVKIHLDLGPDGVLEREALAGDYRVDVEALGAPVSGTAWRRGMTQPKALRGWANVVRTAHAACERDLAARRIDLHARGQGESGDSTLLLVHQTRPDASSRAWLAWRGPEGTLHATSDVEVEVVADGREEHGYPLPTSLAWSTGPLAGCTEWKTPHLSIDPLDALPRLVQMLYSLRARPRRVWSEAARFQLKTGPGSAVLPMGAPTTGGPAVASTTFLRPLDG